MVKIEDAELEAAINNCLLHADMGKAWFTGRDKKTIQIGMGPNVVKREKERAQRAQLDSSHGDTAETHDQFYRDHKLLLILFQTLAVMPITRSSPGKVTFSWRSYATYYAVCFYCVATVVVLFVGRERLEILQTTTKFDDYIYAIVFLMFLVPHFWIPFVGWGVAHQVAIYKTMWGTFQVGSMN